ncbi:MAG: hypothetical protein WBP85_02295 [Terracidiphilus sp.]
MEIVVTGEPMRVSWQKHPLICLLSILAFGAYCIDRAMQYSSAEPGEQSTIAHVHQYGTALHTNCTYDFAVDGITYSGSDCTRGIRSGYFDATVYYDPSRPSINSLDEFGTASKRWYQYAALSICSGCIIFGIVVWWGAYKQSKRGDSGSVAGQ